MIQSIYRALITESEQESKQSDKHGFSGNPVNVINKNQVIYSWREKIVYRESVRPLLIESRMDFLLNKLFFINNNLISLID